MGSDRAGQRGGSQPQFDERAAARLVQSGPDGGWQGPPVSPIGAS